MLVEDDNNLREIYEARLLAEGYEIVSARDGEEALAMAVKEKPDLIISDIMMPKISGFDMLDILRSTPETKNTKVIMMTALSQAEDKSRADKLGADRYLVKSQVTLEDVAKVAREVLDGEDTSTPPAAKVVEASGGPGPSPAPTPVAVAPEPPAVPIPATPPVEPPQDDQTPPVPPTPPVAPEPPAPPPTPPELAEPPTKSAASPSLGGQIPPAVSAPEAQSTAAEQEKIDTQITKFIDGMGVASAPALAPTPQPAVSAPAPPPEPVVPSPPVQPIATNVPVAEPPNDNPPAPPVANSTDNTSAAADNAAALANTVNDLLQRESLTKSDATAATPSIAGKKIIKPLNDITVGGGPDLNKLLAKEQGEEAIDPPLATAVVAPGGETAPPPAAAPQNDQPIDPPLAGGVINPGGNGPVDPNSIAL